MTEDIYPKYRVVKTYDGYVVERLECDPKKATMYMCSYWKWISLDTYRWKWWAERVAKARIKQDAISKERKAHENSVVWGPEP